MEVILRSCGAGSRFVYNRRSIYEGEDAFVKLYNPTSSIGEDMANIPSANYPVTIAPSSNNWLAGTLNTKVSPPTYKGQTTTSSNLDQGNVGWTVQLNNANTNWTVTFTGGVYSSSTNPPSISGGTYSMTSGANSLGGSTDDTWSADQQGEEDDVKARSSYTK
jgi:hypothetical protein